MFFYKVVMCIIVFFLTVVLSVLNPPMHKPFILENANFKLTSSGQEPESLGTLKVFRLGDAPIDEKKLVVQVQQSPAPIKSQTHIEASEYYQIANQKSTQSAYQNQSQNDYAYDKPIVMSDYSQDGSYGQQQEIADSEDIDLAMPLDNSLKSKLLQKKEETIAWNKWRSDLQNRIMGDASVSAPIGTIFFFSFNVDYRHHISNIKVMCSNPFYQEEAVKTIVPVIEGYEGRDFLEFPRKTKRRSVRFDGSYMIWIDTLYSSPENYNDFERVQYYE